MKTIKTKMFMLFASFMIALVICGIILNVLFLEQYYIYKNKSIFISTSEMIIEQYRTDKQKVAELIDNLDRVEAISCTVVNSDLEIKLNSFPQKAGVESKRLPNEIEQLILANPQQLLHESVYVVQEKSIDQAAKLIFLTRMTNGDIIILKKSMKGIRESVFIANEFYVLAGLLMLLLGGLIIFVFSRKITKPLIEMSSVAEEISQLKFDRRVQHISEDEIGSLASSINKISEKLSGSINALQRDVERRKSLVRNISHELKTPIGVIKGYAEGLKFGVVEDKHKIQQYCSVISEECDRMDNMVQELLNLSIIEAGMFQIKFSQFEMSELLEKLADKFETTIAKKGITLNIECQENLNVSADYILLERAISNYFTNAINHTEGKKYVAITVTKRVDRLRIEVFNTGKQIASDDIEHVWDVFYKADKARSREYGGHGLGLSIVRQIAELHGGTTGVTNLQDGVKFFIEIPINILPQL